MIFDLENSEIPNKSFQNFDIVIIGAGAAGITLAINLAKKKRKNIALIEGGGLDYLEESQNLYKGNVIGDPYFELNNARLRFLGGSTNHWSGWCRSFEEIDFKRDYLGEEYTWPIKLNDFEIYKKESCSILEISSNFDDKKILDSNIKSIDFNFSPPVIFKDKYFNELKNSKNISLFINSNLTDFEGGDRQLSSIEIKSLNDNRLVIKGSKFVMSMGGIENSRFLLLIEEKYKHRFFDGGLPIGKYWMEHPHFTLGKLIINRNKVSKRFYSLIGETQKDLNILNCGFRVNHLNESKTKEMIREILCVAPSLGKKIANLAKKNLVCGTTFRAAWEQSPNINNAVKLNNDKDRFGIPRVNLFWKKNNLDRKTLEKSIHEFNKWLFKIDAGRVQLSSWILNNDKYPLDDELAGYHHMGGTRMHNKKEFGVVDSNCKIHGSKNIFVMGSSVFTTGGHNNPTLPIIQLSLRLSDHISI